MLLRQLEYIIAVDVERSFTRAANRCCITQPTLSQQIKSLESHLDITIFNRACTPIEPTHEGRLVLEQARQIVGNAHQLIQIARQLKTTRPHAGIV